MKRNSGVERRRRPRTERTRMLVATEGIETESQYFGLLKQHLKATGIKHLPIDPHKVGKDPLRVLKAALDRKAQDDDFDSVWIVVDVDEHAHFDELFRRAEQSGVKVIVSNPCFEIWLLWHLQDHRRRDTGKALQRVLKEKGYAGKSIPPSFPIGNYSKAMARAGEADPHSSCGAIGKNPSSAMPALINHLLTV